MTADELARIDVIATTCEDNARDWRRRGLDHAAQAQEQTALRLREVIAAAETD